MTSIPSPAPQLLPTEASQQSSLTPFSLGSSHISRSCSTSVAHRFSNDDRNLTIVTASGPNTLILNSSNAQLKAVLPFPFDILEAEAEREGDRDALRDGENQQQEQKRPPSGLVESVGIGSVGDENQQLVFSVSSSLIVFYSTTHPSTSTSQQSFKLHSTLLLPLSSPILTASLHHSYLLIGTTDSISIHKATLDISRQVIWKEIWKKAIPDAMRKVELLCNDAQEEGFDSNDRGLFTFAALCENDDRVLVFEFTTRSSTAEKAQPMYHDAKSGTSKRRSSKPRKEIKPKVTNRLIHSRQVVDFNWRKSEEKDSPQVLVTQTIDGVAKVWMAVIDEPSTLKLWSSMDLSGWGDDSFNSSVDPSDPKGKSTIRKSSCPSFYLDSKALNFSIKTSLQILDQELQMIELGIHEISASANHQSHQALSKNEQENILEKKKTRKKRLEHIMIDSKDLFLRILKNDEICIKALVNLDRKPPTLFESFTVLHLKPDARTAGDSTEIGKFGLDSLHLVPLLPNSSGRDTSISTPTAVLFGSKSVRSKNSSGNRFSFQVGMEMGGLFDGDMKALNVKTKTLDSTAFKFDSPSCSESWEHSLPIRKIYRDHDGKRLMSFSEPSKGNGAMELVFWQACGGSNDLSYGLGVAQSTTFAFGSAALSENRVALLPHGLGMAFIDSASSIKIVSKSGPEQISCSTSSDDELSFMTTNRSSSSGQACFLSASTREGAIFLWEIKFTSPVQSPQVELINQSSIPQDQDMNSLYFNIQQSFLPSFGSISSKGEIQIHAFKRSSQWDCTAQVNTGRENISHIRTNASGQIGMISTSSAGCELSIWSPQESEFCSGLEHSEPFDEAIEAIEWSLQGMEKARPLLAVATSSKVKIFCPTRLQNDAPVKEDRGWRVVSEIDISNLTPNKINSLAFLSNNQLLIASSNQVLSFGPYLLPPEKEKQHLMQFAAEEFGNLKQHHPVMIKEFLKWGKIGIAKKVLVNLWNSIKHLSPRNQLDGDEKEVEEELIQVQEVPYDHFLEDEESNLASEDHLKQKPDALFGQPSHGLDESEAFSSALASQLLGKLQAFPPSLLSLTQQELEELRIIIQTVSEVDEHRETLDVNGLRYLASLKAFIISRKDSVVSSEAQVTSTFTFGSKKQEVVAKSSNLPRLSSRDMLWAFHSSSQEILTSILSNHFSKKLDWAAARSTGMFFWIRDVSVLRSQAEEVAKAQYMSGEDRDPVSCSLLYYALGKNKLVLGLWKQAAWHPEQKKMLAFLKNDFEEQRWKTASKKNAFALLSQRRFEFAAVFFMLGDALQDAVNVVVRHLEDLDLAVALTRIKEGGDRGPVFQDLVRNRVLPKSLEEGDRPTSSWAFWKLGRKDLAVEVLMKPVSSILKELKISELLPAESLASLEKSNSNKSGSKCFSIYHSDPTLASLLPQLKANAPAWLHSIEGRSAEWQYVLHVNRMLIRMGCPLLGLSLLRNWNFHSSPSSAAEIPDSPSSLPAEGPLDSIPSSTAPKSSLITNEIETSLHTPSKLSQKDSSFLGVSPSSIRPAPPGTSTIFESMSPSKSGSSIASGETQKVEEREAKSGEKKAKKGLGLMKEATSSTKQGAQEFSFDSFGF